MIPKVNYVLQIRTANHVSLVENKLGVKIMKTSESGRKYGWIPQHYDERDIPFKLSAPISLPPSVVNSINAPPVRSQFDLGCCTGFGVRAVHLYDQMQQDKNITFDPSPLFIYFNERVMENTVESDSGAQIRDGIKVIAKYGVCSENLWTYDIGKFRDKPTDECYTEALNHQALVYRAVAPTMQDIKTALATNHPIVYGMSIYQSFESRDVARTGIVPMPVRGERMIGGHCMTIFDYYDDKQWCKVQNSWGEGWGDKGWCYVPYAYLEKYASDFWVVSSVEI